MKQTLKIGCLVVAAAAGLAACGGGGDGGGVFTPPPVVVVKPQDNFGTAFAQIFNKDANSDPTDPVPDNAAPALTLSADASEIPN